MNIIKTPLTDALIIEPKIHYDNRGYFFEAFNLDTFKELSGVDFKIKQINQSKSIYGTLRGLHFQKPPMEQAKLVSVVEGSILDVIVDIRKDSDTYGKWFDIRLDDIKHQMLYVPRGFAHGFVALKSSTSISYLVDNDYSKEHEDGIVYDDKTLDIDWVLHKSLLHLSEKDLQLNNFTL